MNLKAHKTLFGFYMKDTALCIKFTILEKCLHYIMITPRNSITVNDFASLFNCTPFGPASDSMMSPT